MDRRFLLLWAGQTISGFGTQISLLAIPTIAILTLHASPAQTGLLCRKQGRFRLFNMEVRSMKTYPRIGLSLVLELVAYASLAALHLINGEAVTLSYGLLVIAVSLRIYRHFRVNRKSRSDSHDSLID